MLEWNKAFEKIGFKDAIRVEQQPDDATWSTPHETGRASCAGSLTTTMVRSRLARRAWTRALARFSMPTSPWATAG